MSGDSGSAGTFCPEDHPHNRLNPLTGRWVLVSPHRAKRPWKGQVEKLETQDLAEFDPSNPLCPGVVRANGKKTEEYTSTYVFDNDFPALLQECPDPPESTDPLFVTASARGTCKVVCFHPKSNVTLPQMSLTEVEAVIDTWIAEFKLLSATYEWVQIFENRGEMMGCSNPHPHGQIWACDFLPTEASVKNERQKEYFEKFHRPLLFDYVSKELSRRERIVASNSTWVCLVPFWATWPFETMIIPRRHVARLDQLQPEEKVGLAQIIRALTTKYDNLFQCSFPYSMGFHGAPTGRRTDPEVEKYWQLHGIYYPPLLRSASVRKFMVGYEMLCQPQRDVTPEVAAQQLRDCSDIHYKL